MGHVAQRHEIPILPRRCPTTRGPGCRSCRKASLAPDGPTLVTAASSGGPTDGRCLDNQSWHGTLDPRLALAASLLRKSPESLGMPTLTRCRGDNPHRETCVYYGDVRVGSIGQRAGVPIDVDQWQWQWSCGFQPGLNPGQHRQGTAASFEEARVGFEVDWRDLLPRIPDGAFDEWRHQRDFTEEKYAAWARGEKLPSQIPSSIMRCVCGVRFDSWKPAEPDLFFRNPAAPFACSSGRYDRQHRRGPARPTAAPYPQNGRPCPFASPQHAHCRETNARDPNRGLL